MGLPVFVWDDLKRRSLTNLTSINNSKKLSERFYCIPRTFMLFLNCSYWCSIARHRLRRSCMTFNKLLVNLAICCANIAMSSKLLVNLAICCANIAMSSKLLVNLAICCANIVTLTSNMLKVIREHRSLWCAMLLILGTGSWEHCCLILEYTFVYIG
jgi:hypothetical protein